MAVSGHKDLSSTSMMRRLGCVNRRQRHRAARRRQRDVPGTRELAVDSGPGVRGHRGLAVLGAHGGILHRDRDLLG